MAQKTTLTLDQVIEYLKDAIEPQTGEEAEQLKGYPLYLLINELGELFSGGGDATRRAETKLVELLDHENAGARWIAYRYLQDAKRSFSEENAAAFAAFCENPDNVRITEHP